jgi:hypothetical protein
MVPPHGTMQNEKIYIKQQFTAVNFQFVARVNLKLWHNNFFLLRGIYQMQRWQKSNVCVYSPWFNDSKSYVKAMPALGA